MADSTDDHDDDDEEDLVPIKRPRKALASRTALPSVDGALDDFIVSANQKLLDVTEFTAESREQQLRGEIAELEKKLAATQARLDKYAEAPPTQPLPAAPARSWGLIIGAFIVGGGIAFGAAKAMQPSSPAQLAGPTAPPAAPASPSQIAAPPTQLAAPPEQPAVAATPTAPIVAAKQAPSRPKAPLTSTPPKTPQASKTPQTSKTPTGTSTTSTHSDPVPAATKPPPAQDGSGSDLYNPF